MFDYADERLHEIAAEVLATARRLGASDAAVDVSEASGLSVNVRMGGVETIEQTRDKGVGVTVYVGKRRGHASTSDFSPKALQDAVDAAWQIARHTGEDDCAGLPDAARSRARSTGTEAAAASEAPRASSTRRSRRTEANRQRRSRGTATSSRQRRGSQHASATRRGSRGTATQ